jgi:hypothetical protein
VLPKSPKEIEDAYSIDDEAIPEVKPSTQFENPKASSSSSHDKISENYSQASSVKKIQISEKPKSSMPEEISDNYSI